jgi:hypothetical protein
MIARWKFWDLEGRGTRYIHTQCTSNEEIPYLVPDMYCISTGLDEGEMTLFTPCALIPSTSLASMSIYTTETL